MTDTRAALRSIVDRIERLDEEIKALNGDKRDIYAEAKSNGFDVPALKSVIAIRRKGIEEVEEHNAVVDTYLSALGTNDAIARVHVRESHTNAQRPSPSVKPSSGAVPHSEAPHAGTGSETCVGREGRQEGAGANARPALTDDPLLGIPPFLDRRASAEAS